MIPSLSSRIQVATSSIFSEALAGAGRMARTLPAPRSKSEDVYTHTSDFFSPIFQNFIEPATHTSVKRALGGTVNTSSLYTTKQVEIIQASACAVAGASLCGVLITLYWFFRMKKKFRHNLIIILIIGDLIRSLFLFIFPLVSLTKGHIPSTAPFCQASGYLTQAGIEAADLAIFLIALHTLLQIFKPRIGSYGELDNGLYRYRNAVYVIAAVVPAGWTALAFIGRKDGFLSQGPTCSLPLRPYWYRLAISWIPRYVIMIAVMIMYIVIYIYVGRQNGTFTFFGLFRQHKQWETVVASTKNSSAQAPFGGRDSGAAGSKRFSRSKLRVDTSNVHDGTFSPTEPVFLTSVLSDVESTSHSRKESDGTTLVSYTSLEFAHSKPILVTPQYEQGEAPTVIDFDGNYDGPGERKKSVLSRVSERFTRSPTSPTGSEPFSPTPEPQQLIGKKIMTKHMRKRQNAIQRQLGLLFLYPLCYFITYIPPFVAHAMNYTDYYVQHPIVSLNILSFICLASIGWVDALVFSLRERPWRHIPGSDGTFWGSFRFWDNKNTRRTSDESVVETTEMDTGATGSRRESRPMSRRNELMRSHEHISPQQPGTPDQRDSWIINAQPLGNIASVGPEFRSLRVPSWTHFRSNSAVLAAGPIMEEGGEVHHSTYASALHIPTSPHPQQHSTSHSPLAAHDGARGERWGSMNSTLSSLGSEEGVDRELANMDRLLDRAVMREWSRPDR